MVEILQVDQEHPLVVEIFEADQEHPRAHPEQVLGLVLVLEQGLGFLAVVWARGPMKIEARMPAALVLRHEQRPVVPNQPEQVLEVEQERQLVVLQKSDEPRHHQ